MSNEFNSQGSRLVVPTGKPVARKSNPNGNKNPRRNVANLDHHRLYREIEQLARHGREVLARTLKMMSLLETNLQRAQGFVDEQNRRKARDAEILEDPARKLKSRKSSAERRRQRGSVADSRTRR
jgi:hypothetical protein